MNEGPVIWPGRHRLSAVRSVEKSKKMHRSCPWDPCTQTLHPWGQGVSPVCRGVCGTLQAGKGVGGSEGGRKAPAEAQRPRRAAKEFELFLRP